MSLKDQVTDLDIDQDTLKGIINDVKLIINKEINIFNAVINFQSYFEPSII
jgi:hypothetical protein